MGRRSFSLGLPARHLTFLLTVTILDGREFSSRLNRNRLRSTFNVVDNLFNRSGSAVTFHTGGTVGRLMGRHLVDHFDNRDASKVGVCHLAPLTVNVASCCIHRHRFSGLGLSVRLAVITRRVRGTSRTTRGNNSTGR